jgi:hypothetical protein
MKRIVFALAVLLGGCGSAPPETVQYLLRPPAGDGVTRLDSNFDVALGRLSVAPYLDQEGIVLEGESRRIIVARNHRWSESLSQSLRRVMQVGIGNAAGSPVGDVRAGALASDVVVDINFYQFHGSLSGDVKLVANWLLRSAQSNEELGSFEFAGSTRTAADGYDALVQAHMDLLEQLADEIAETLQRQTNTGENR